MTEQTPVPIDETAVEPEKTTNDLDEQDDVWVDENQADEAEPDYGHTVADEDEPAAADGIQVLHQDGDTTLYGHPAGVRIVDNPDSIEAGGSQ